MAGMSMDSTTLKEGDPAPDFKLLAGNRDRQFTLASMTKDAPVILEFLRGTW
jgi:peroxiredoxin